MTEPLFEEQRASFHAALLKGPLSFDGNVWANADKRNKSSSSLAAGIAARIIEDPETRDKQAGQTSGAEFEVAVCDYIRTCFEKLPHLRPGRWNFYVKDAAALSRFEQYAHLAEIERLAKEHEELKVVLGNDYLIKPDILVSREPETDRFINRDEWLVNDDVAIRASIRSDKSPFEVLHASVSCKWTIRSDRSQNSRTEALNLIRNRKGHLPHIAIVSAEPLPSRLVSVALGTGDIDCMYHFALPELQQSLEEFGLEDQADQLRTLVDGKRLKDISDLPLDLAV
ncbi:MAG TPA: NgoMIV family type II restriction endonuclease [Chthoniobacterales bacterium]